MDEMQDFAHHPHQHIHDIYLLFLHALPIYFSSTKHILWMAVSTPDSGSSYF